MNKAFVKESDNDDDDEALALAQAIPAGSKNYITPAGHKAIKDELLQRGVWGSAYTEGKGAFVLEIVNRARAAQGLRRVAAL